MRLIVMRHGETEASGYAEDDLRRLTEKGKTRQRQAVQTLKTMQLIPDKIYCSPLIRAIESAEILAEGLHIPLEQIEALGLLFDEEALLDLIEMHANENLLFVGHMPTLPTLVNYLVGKPVLNAIKQSVMAIIELHFPLRDQRCRLINYLLPSD